MRNLAVIFNTIINSTPKVARRTKYLMQDTLPTFTSTVEKSTPKVARRAKYLMQDTLPTFTSTVEKSTTKATRMSKYLQSPTEVVVNASENITAQNKAVNNLLNKFNKYIGKDLDSIPIEDCIELKELIISTFRTGSLNANTMSMIKSELPFLTNDSMSYLKLLEKLEQRIQQYPINFNYHPLSMLTKDSEVINKYNSLAENDKKFVDLLHGLKQLSSQDSKILVNQSGSKFALNTNEQVRLARILEALRILQETEKISNKEIEHIAYRLHTPKDIEILSLIEPKTKVYEEKLNQALSKIERKSISTIEQTSRDEIISQAKLTDVAGHKVRVCDIDNIEKLSGFYHTPESYGDGMMGLPTRNDVYRRFANFKEVLSKPTNDMPVCFTYGTKDNPILWADNGFFLNIPNRSIHAGGTHDLGSHCSNLDSCIDDYVFGLSTSSNNVGEFLHKGLSMPEILSKTTTHNEYLCTNGQIQAFYTNDIKTMDKAYLELAEKYNIPIINLHGNGRGII